MVKSTILAVVVAAFVGFVVGALWYSPLLFGRAYAALAEAHGVTVAGRTPSPIELAIEFIRCLVVAGTFAYFIAQLGVRDVLGALKTALIVWIGFQAFVLSGAVLHEGYPVRVFLIHAGDALAKSIVYCVIIMLWYRRAAA